MTKNLLKQINKKMFAAADFDEVLDGRDMEEFDNEWCRVYDTVEALKEEKGYSEKYERESENLRKKAYLKVYDLCEDSDLAAYISDDFGLIFDSECMDYQDAWLDKMIMCYQNGEIPYGELTPNK